MRLSVIAVVVLAVASLSVAAPSLTWTITDVPEQVNLTTNAGTGEHVIVAAGTVKAVQVFVNDPDAGTGSWACNIVTAGTAGAVIHQLQVNPVYGMVDVDTQTDAISYDAPTHPTIATKKNNNYAMAGDTWMGTPWAPIGGDVWPTGEVDENGLSVDTNSWNVHLGTAAGQGNILLGQWAMTGNLDGFLSITGTVSRAGQDYAVDYLIPLPEPATMSLLGLGLFGLLRRRNA